MRHRLSAKWEAREGEGSWSHKEGMLNKEDFEQNFKKKSSFQRKGSSQCIDHAFCFLYFKML